MKLHRFYIEQELRMGEMVEVDNGEKIHQWLSVFRFGTGDSIILFNGDGDEFHAEFAELHKKGARLTIGESNRSTMPKKEIHLYMAIIKKDLFELVVEKATELGVSSITPIITERVQVKNLNYDRLKKIAIEASEQCGRGDVPIINQTIDLESAIKNAKGDILVAEMDGVEVASLNLESSVYSLFIGPEGGWGDNDKKLLTSCKRVSLADTVLRAETAGIVGVAFLVAAFK